MQFIHRNCKWVSTNFPITILLTVFASVVLACGTFYWYMTPTPNGIYISNDPAKDFNWFDGIYVSVVTASALGYGDYRPEGWSRFIATSEVVIGLFIIGALITSYTSKKIVSIVSSSLTYNMRGQLEIFTKSFRDIENDIQSQRDLIVISSISDLQYVGGNFRSYLRGFRREIRSCEIFIGEEDTIGLFFDFAPLSSLADMLWSMSGSIESFIDFFMTYDSGSREANLPPIFGDMNRRIIVETMVSAKSISEIVFSGLDIKIEDVSPKIRTHKSSIFDALYTLDGFCDVVLGRFSDVPKDTTDAAPQNRDDPPLMSG